MASLAVLVESQLKLNPFADALFVFGNRRFSAIKMLYWERNGLPLAETVGDGPVHLAESGRCRYCHVDHSATGVVIGGF